MKDFLNWIERNPEGALFGGFFSFIALVALFVCTGATISTIYGPPDQEKEIKKVQTEMQVLELQIKLAEMQGRIKSK